MDEGKTRIPANLNEEDPFLSLAELKLSLRQLLTIILSGMVWMLVTQGTTWILPVNSIFAGLIWSWILIGGLFLAIWKKDGRPYEEHLSNKIVFFISDRHFIQKDPKAKDGSIEDADWEEVDDDDDLMPPRF